MKNYSTDWLYMATLPQGIAGEVSGCALGLDTIAQQVENSKFDICLAFTFFQAASVHQNSKPTRYRRMRRKSKTEVGAALSVQSVSLTT